MCRHTKCQTFTIATWISSWTEISQQLIMPQLQVCDCWNFGEYKYLRIWHEIFCASFMSLIQCYFSIVDAHTIFAAIAMLCLFSFQFMCAEGQGDSIDRIDEPSSCVYILTIHTTRICHHPFLRPPPSLKPKPVLCFPALEQAQYDQYTHVQKGILCIDHFPSPMTQNFKIRSYPTVSWLHCVKC